MKYISGNRLVVIVGMLVTGLMLAGCGKSGNKSPQGGAPEVAVVTMAEERVALTTELPGRTSAYLVAEVRPQVSGIIQKRLFTEGGDVKAGEVLYQIDPATYEAAYAGAKAALARAEAQVVTIRNKMQRYKELVAINAVSQQDYDDMVASLKQAEADIEANKANTENARINLARTQVTSPVSGRIGKSSVTTGALVTASQSSYLAVVQQLDPVYVDAMQSSASLLQLKQNIASGKIKGGSPDQAKVKLLLEDGTPYPVDGALKFSDITVEAGTGSVTLRMIFPNPKHILLPGMYVRAIVQEGVVEKAILAPQEGVSRDTKGNPLALVVDRSGKVEQRMLKLDRAVGNKWLVTEGLGKGDQLIVEGSQKVRPGVAARAVPFSPENNKGAAGPAKTVQPVKKAK